MSVRDELRAIIDEAMDDWDGPAPDSVDKAADAVLAFLGQLDPNADPELIALHLRDSREEIAVQRKHYAAARAQAAALLAEREALRAAAAEHLATTENYRSLLWGVHSEFCVSDCTCGEHGERYDKTLTSLLALLPPVEPPEVTEPLTILRDEELEG